MGKINAELLIAAVQSRLVLWQDRHRDYKNKTVTNALWKEVGQICNCSGAAAKAKWKNLKDTFRRALQKSMRTGLGTTAEQGKGKWLYFDMMTFVKQTISFETTQENMRESEQYSFAEETSYSQIVKEEDDEEMVFVDVNRPSTSSPSTIYSYSPPAAKRKREEISDLDAEFLDIEKQRLKVMKLEADRNREDSDDVHFFKSLSPFMAKFSDLEKLEIRGDILKIILEKLKRKNLK